MLNQNVFFSLSISSAYWQQHYGMFSTFYPGTLSLSFFTPLSLIYSVHCTDASYSHGRAALVLFTTWTKFSSGFLQIAVFLPKLPNDQWTSEIIMETVKEMKFFFLGFTIHLFLPFSAVREIDTEVVPPTWVRQSGQAFRSPCLHLGWECKEV